MATRPPIIITVHTAGCVCCTAFITAAVGADGGGGSGGADGGGGGGCVQHVKHGNKEKTPQPFIDDSTGCTPPPRSRHESPLCVNSPICWLPLPQTFLLADARLKEMRRNRALIVRDARGIAQTWRCPRRRRVPRLGFLPFHSTSFHATPILSLT